MSKYRITPELSEYIGSLQSAKNYTSMFVVAINYALRHQGQPPILTQSDLDEFLQASGINL